MDDPLLNQTGSSAARGRIRRYQLWEGRDVFLCRGRVWKPAVVALCGWPFALVDSLPIGFAVGAHTDHAGT